MTSTTPERNKALVLEAFDTLFNKRDYEAASRFWADKYIQHSAKDCVVADAVGIEPVSSREIPVMRQKTGNSPNLIPIRR